MNPAKKKKLERLRSNDSIAPVSEIAYTPSSEKKLIPVANKKIIGFWHICMINHYEEIIKEQLDLLLISELYQECEDIIVVCCGDINEFRKMQALFLPYIKIKTFHNPKITEFEFSTLKYLKHIVDTTQETFFTFYIHTKGVSYPSNEGGKYWRDYMNYYNITEWKSNVEKLKEGYNTCGVKLIPKAEFPMHYSGNFWWANSEYVKKLPQINTLNHKDRFQAEMWICSKDPIAATLCQDFVDYNTKGKFNPAISKPRTIVHTLAYNLASEVRDTTKLLYEQNKKEDFTHVIVDLGFPINEGNEIPDNIEHAKLLNAKSNIETAIEYGSQFVSYVNEGVSQNWERVRNQFVISDKDVLICADPDERTQHNGWVKAIADVLRSNNKIAWCSLMMKEHEPYTVNKRKIKIAGHDVYILNEDLNWAQGGFSGKFLNEIKGIPVPDGAPVYGWLETACTEKMKSLGYVVAILCDYYVEHTECSPLYRLWKTDITTNWRNGQITFDKWLIKNSHKLLADKNNQAIVEPENV